MALKSDQWRLTVGRGLERQARSRISVKTDSLLSALQLKFGGLAAGLIEPVLVLLTRVEAPYFLSQI